MPDAMVAARASEATSSGKTQAVDVAVVGAGFAGLYLLHRLRKAGFTTVALDEADDVGGTWYWNRYPGARCDIQTIDYSYTFDPELETRVDMVGEIRDPARNPALSRLRRRPLRPAARHPLSAPRSRRRTGIRPPNAGCSRPTTAPAVSCRYYIMATGCLSAPKPPEIEGVKDFKGEVYFTGRWPHDGVNLAGKRVAVIGTGSSGIQSIPLIAEQAAASHRVPTHAELRPARPQWSGAGGPRGLAGRRPRRLPRAGPLVARRRAAAATDRGQLAAQRCRAPRALREGVGRRRSRLHADPVVGRPGRRCRRQCAAWPSCSAKRSAASSRTPRRRRR